MHIFLTGAVQVGKSTIITKVMYSSGLTVGGFRTSFGPDRGEPDRLLYLYAAGEPPALDEPHGVVRFVNRIPVPIPGRFEALGIPLLRRARAHAGLILMDECGFLESDAVAFQAEILKTLDGETPVLAAVKNRMDVEFLRQVCAHPRAEVVPINPENREELFRALLPVVSGWKK